MNNNPYQEKNGTVQFYRAFLCDRRMTNQAFASKSGNEDIEHALEVFDRLAKFGNGEMAIKVSLASTNLNHLLSDAGKYVARQLANLPKDTTIEGNSLRRLRSIYQRLNENIAKCSITINRKDYSIKEIAEAQFPLPKALQDKSWDYSLETAAGSIKGKLVLTVID